MNDIFEEMLDVELKDDDVHGTLRNVIKIKKIIFFFKYFIFFKSELVFLLFVIRIHL